MFKKQVIVLALILCLQNSSGFLGTLLQIINGAGMVMEVIKTLPPVIRGVSDVISTFTSGPRPMSLTYISSEAEDLRFDYIEVLDPLRPNSEVHSPVVAQRDRSIAEYHKKLKTIFDDIHTQFDNLGVHNVERFQQMQQLINDLPDKIDIMLKKQITGEFITNINREWDRVMSLMKRGARKLEYHHLMSVNLQYIEQNLVKFRVAVTPKASMTFSDSGLLTEIARMQLHGNIVCNGETTHHHILHIFRMIITSEVKASILQVLALDDYCSGDRNEWEALFRHSQIEYKEQMKRYLDELKNVLRMDVDPYITGCITKDFQCLDVMSSEKLYYHPRVPVETCIPYDSMLGCDDLYDCQYVSPQIRASSTLCFKPQQKYHYHYPILKVHNQSSLLSKNEDNCSVVNLQGKQICTCTCGHYEKFILALMQSRVNQNYVGVAMRFQKTNNYIYIQLAEGKLEADGYISDFTWIQVTEKKSGEDPFDASLTINERKTIALDKVLLPHEYILTGIKFTRKNLYGEKGFKIGLYGVKFDYDTGKLDPMNETFVLAEDLPLCNGCSRNKVWNENSSYSLVEFRSSDYKFMNSPRSMPCLNGLPVQPNPLTPIRGVGISLESLENQPRLSLRLFALDYIRYIDINSYQKLNESLPITP